MAISRGDGSIILETKVDTAGVDKGVKSMKHSVKSMSSGFAKLGKTIAAAFSVGVMVKFVKSATQAASDLEEVQNVVDNAFGEMKYKMEEFADTALKTYGISKLTAKRTGSIYMAMAKGMGLADDVASDMALTLTGLTSDMASFYNISQDMADVAIKSVFTGETESLKRFGIVMTEINLQEFARAQGIEKSISAMNQQEKTMLRYQYVLDQTRLVQGDFARTSDSWANQTRLLSERWKEITAVFGEAFIRIGKLLIPALNKLLDVMEQLAYVANIASINVAKLFGKNLENNVKQTEQEADNIKQSGKNQKELTNEVKETTKALNKSLAGFDEINTLTSGYGGGESGLEDISALTGSSGAGGAVGGGSDTFKPEEYADRVSSSLLTIMSIVGDCLAAIGLILIFSGHIGSGIVVLLAGLGLSAGAEAAGEDVPQTVEQKLTEVAAVLSISTALLGLGLILISCGVVNGTTIGMVVTGAAGIVKELALNWSFITDQIKGTVADIIAILSWGMIVIGVILLFAGVSIPLALGMIAFGAVGMATAVSANWGYIVTAMQGRFGKVMAIVSLFAIVIGIILLFTGVGVPLGLGIIFAGATGLGTAVAFNWDYIVNAVKGVWEKIKQFWEAHMHKWFTAEHWKQLGKNVINGFTSAISAGINGIIGLVEKAINWIVHGLNKLSFDIPEWVPGVGGKTFGFNISDVNFGRVEIPKLAQGAVIPANREFLAVLGDQKSGTNIETPLSTMIEAFNKALDNRGYNNRELVLEVDGREFGRAVVDLGDTENRRRGVRMAGAY